MAISPNFAVSPTVTVPAAYAGGAGEYQKWLAQLELQYASMLNQSQQRGADRSTALFGQVLDNAFTQGRMSTNAALQDVIANNAAVRRQGLEQIRFQNARQLIQDRADADIETANAIQGFRERSGYAQNAIQTRAAIDQSLGSVDVSSLTPEGQHLHSALQRDLSALDRDFQTGKIRPRDYFLGLSNVAGRARQLASPRFIAQKPPSVKEMIDSGEIYFDDQRNLVIRKDPRNPSGLMVSTYNQNEAARYESGKGIGDTWVEPGAGIVTRTKNGEVKVLTPAQEILEKAEESMIADGLSRAENPEFYDKELQERFIKRMNILLGENVEQAGQPQEAEAPTQNQPIQTLTDNQPVPDESLWLQPWTPENGEQFRSIIMNDPGFRERAAASSRLAYEKLIDPATASDVPVEQVVLADAFRIATGTDTPLQQKIQLPEATDETIRSYLQAGRTIMSMRPDGKGMGQLLSAYLAEINRRIAEYRAKKTGIAEP